MSLQRIPAIILCLVLLMLISTKVWAQRETARHSHRAMDDIEAAYQEGSISLDQKVLYKFYAGLKQEKLPSQFKIPGLEFIKCGTPANIDFLKYKNELSPSTVSEIENLNRQSATQAEELHLSPSGKFMFHYETTGTNAIPLEDANGNNVPDYVEWAAAAADSTWRHEVNNLGYTDPIESTPYNIYFQNFNFYGLTSPGNSTYPCESQDKTCIYLHNNYINFPPNTDPEGNEIGALKVTVAHELKHAIQYANSEWYTSVSGSPHNLDWSEMDATFMEEVVYDNVNDYYNYFRGSSSSNIFESTNHSIPVAYDGVSWFIYFDEQFGSGFWVNVWSRVRQRFEEQQQISSRNYLSMKEALVLTLEEDFGTSLPYVFSESHLWHFASGPNNSSPDYGFEEREEYPNPTVNQSYTGKDSSATAITLGGFNANYIVLNPGLEEEGFIRIEMARSNLDTGIGLIAYLKDGTTEQQIFTGGTALNLAFQTPWQWTDINRVGIVVTNGSENINDSYSIKITSDIPDEISLSQNYPNPFNPGTFIPFNLSEETRVQIKIYDITGRLVTTLLDEERPAGFYFDVRFNGSNLASGVYFYQLITDQKVLSKKMTLIK